MKLYWIYLRGYDKYIHSEIFALQFPKDKIEVANEKIKEIMKINNNNYESKHNIDTDYGSSCSPIILSGSSLVIGIHKEGDKKEKINYATFIGNIFKNNKLNKINNGEEIKD